MSSPERGTLALRPSEAISEEESDMLQQTTPPFSPGIEQVADGVWAYDDQPIATAGLRLPIRMVIIRLRFRR
jgi:hypothetical protein